MITHTGFIYKTFYNKYLRLDEQGDYLLVSGLQAATLFPTEELGAGNWTAVVDSIIKMVGSGWPCHVTELLIAIPATSYHAIRIGTYEE